MAGWWWVRVRPRWATPSQVSLVEITARACENLAGVVSVGLAHDNNESLVSLVEITTRVCENLAGVVSLGLAHDNNGSLLLR